MAVVELLSLRIGKVAPLGKSGVKSGIGKRSTNDAILLTKVGFAGDEQADTRHHGGIEKAVHHYDYDHYEFWRGKFGKLPVLDGPGAFGENLSTTGLSEKDVAIGDVYRLGGAVIEVSQGRQPCFKLNLRFSVPDMALQVQNSGRTGWYYRVLEEGKVRASDQLMLIERKNEEWTIHRLWRALYVVCNDWDELSKMTNLEALTPSWRDLATKRLNSRKIEDWSKRLNGV